MVDVVAIGDINIDIVAPISSYPLKGGDGVSEHVEFRVGGSALNTAVVLGKMGVKVGLVGRVGRDALAAQAMAELEEAGVDVRFVQIDPVSSTGLVFIAITPDGERTMFACREANINTDPDMIPEEYIRQARWVHISGYSLLNEPQRLAALKCAEVGRQAGCRISLDVGVEPALKAKKEVLRLLPYLDVIMPSETEIAGLSGSEVVEDGIRYLLEEGVGAVAAKMGEKGCIMAGGGVLEAVPAFNVRPLDTTGAGDSFDAGVIIGMLCGWERAVTALFSNALGGMVTQFPGAGAVYLDPAAVRDFVSAMQNVDGDVWEMWSDTLKGVMERLSSLIEGQTR